MQLEGRPPVEAGGPEDCGKTPPEAHCNTKYFSMLAPRFHSLFAGLERAYGKYTDIARDQSRGDGKLKGAAATVRAAVTDQLWSEHLAGRDGLGIIPIRDDSTAVFGGYRYRCLQRYRSQSYSVCNCACEVAADCVPQ
jgi:hypothetical protein